MQKCIEGEFDVLLTIDKNLQFQQGLKSYAIAVVLFDVEKSKIEFFDELIPVFKHDVFSFQKGKAYRLSARIE